MSNVKASTIGLVLFVSASVGCSRPAGDMSANQIPNTPAVTSGGSVQVRGLAAPMLVAGGNTISAYSLYDVAGVVTHLRRDSYSSAYPQMESLLSGLGITHIRDGFGTRMDPNYVAELKRLYQQYRIDVTMTAAVGQTGSLWSQYAANMGGSMVAIEGVNEPNNGVSNWDPAPARQLQKDIWVATHGGQSNLAGVKSVNASVLGCSGNAQYGDQSAYTDYANLHKYWPGFNPNSSGYGSSTCGSSAQYGSLEYNVLAVQQSAHHTIYETETGYCDANIHSCVPDAVAATYEPEIVLTDFLYNGLHNGGGFARAFFYQLVAEDTTTKTGTLGLTDPNFAPKPEYYAIAGMQKRIRDTPGTARQYTYSLGGTTSHLRTISLSFSDGTYGLILFQDVQVWDSNGSVTPQGSPLNVPADNVTLSVAGQTLQNVVSSTYGPNGQWSDTRKNGTQPLALTVGNNMVIVKWTAVPAK